MREKIIIRGASQHNLKNVDAEIPRNKLVVITGLSGSGKSSLAFDTLYAEGQRRYVESLSAYARQFLDRLQKPKVEHIEGLSPAIAIEQRTAGGTPRSTVATVTEIYDYLRLLYAHIGHPHCPDCGKSLTPQSAQKIVELLQKLPPDRKMILLAPIIKGKKGEHREILQQLREDGFVRARIDGEIVLLDDYGDKVPAKTKAHSIDAVVDRLKTGSGDVSRLTDSVETALRTGNGVLSVLVEQLVSANIRRAGTPAKAICLDPADTVDPVLEARKEGFRDACKTAGIKPVMLRVKPDVEFIRFGLDKLLTDPGVPLVICSPMRSLTGVVLEWAGRHKLALQQDLFYSDFDNPYSLSNPEKAVLSAIQDYTRIGWELYDALRTWGKTAEPIRRKVSVRPVP